MSKLQERNVAEERVYTVEEIAREGRISRTAAYKLVKKVFFGDPGGEFYPDSQETFQCMVRRTRRLIM